MTEPVLTWNLFVTLLAIPIFIFVVNFIIKKAFESFQTGWTLYHNEKEKNLNDWRLRITDSICDLKDSMDIFKQKFPSMITQDQCDDVHEDIFETINNHGQKISVLETKMSYLEKKETK